MGNHEQKLLRALQGRNVQITHGLGESLAEIEAVPADDRPALVEALKTWLDGLISHYVLDDGKLVVAHAGLKEEMQGRGSGAVREFALYGDTTGETDEFGLPVRLNWAADYRGKAMVVYGHTPVPEPEWLNNTIDVDTGCVFGGKLTALRYPEREFVSVPARQTYYEPARPFLAPEDHAPRLTAQQEQDDMLDLDDVIGKRLVETRLAGKVTIREENAAAALEVMSRFAVDPRWLDLPAADDVAERDEPGAGPARAPGRGVRLLPDQRRPAGRRRGEAHGLAGGRRRLPRRRRGAEAVRRDRRQRRLDLHAHRPAVLRRAAGRPRSSTASRRAIDAAGTWDELATDWVLLDAELMPWSAKAQELIRQQYAPTGVAARTALAAVIGGARCERRARRRHRGDRRPDARPARAWPSATSRPTRATAGRSRRSTTCGSRRSTSWRPRGRRHTDRDHVWHMETLAAICRAGRGAPARDAVPRRRRDRRGRRGAAAVAWWEELTGRGGEGMVVKPLDFIPPRGQKRPVQPAVKCRGREYLRIIYGPEYTLPEHLERLRERGLAGKRGLALREFALGIEALERFVARRAAAPRPRVRLRRPRARERAGRPAAVGSRARYPDAWPASFLTRSSTSLVRASPSCAGPGCRID